MTDIVERLEKNCPCSSDIGCADALCLEAATEITRLRAENERLRDVLMRIGLPGKQIVYCRDGHEEVVLLARAALKENSE